MRPIVITLGTLQDDADGAFLAQTLGSATAVNLNGALVTGGVVFFDIAQKISIASVGNDSGINVTIVGLDADGKATSEVLILANIGTVNSVNYYTQIISITTSGATAGDISGGPLRAQGGSSKTIVMNYAQKGDFNIGLALKLLGTINVTIRHTADNPFDTISGGFINNATWFDTTGLISVTSDSESNLIIGVFALQILINSSGADGSLVLTALQGG